MSSHLRQQPKDVLGLCKGENKALNRWKEPKYHTILRLSRAVSDPGVHVDHVFKFRREKTKTTSEQSLLGVQCRPVILALERLRQEEDGHDLYYSVVPELPRESQHSSGLTLSGKMSLQLCPPMS